MMLSQMPLPTNPPKMMLKSSFSTSPQFSPALLALRSPSDGYSNQNMLPTSIVSSDTRISSHSIEDSTVATTTIASSKPGHTSPQASALAFCPSQYNLYACINCGNQYDHVPTDASTKRVGPVLLELRRLDIVNDLESRKRGQVFASASIAVSRGNPALGNSVSSTCLSFRPYPDLDPRILVPCATGLTTGGLCVHSFSEEANGDIIASRDYFASRHHRAATAVAWRPKSTRHVAIGLVGIGGATSGAGGGRRGGPRPVGGGDKDFCCLLWDVEGQPSSKGAAVAPLSKHSHNAGVASMSWISEGQTLAVGCQVRNMQLYDLRVSGNSAPPSSVWAHNDAVNGIEVDPQRSHMLATFSRGPEESVKLWDLRHMDAAVGEIKFSALKEEGRVDGQFVTAVRWSCTQVGSLAVAYSNVVQHYDTTAFGSRPILTGSNVASTPIIDIAVNPLSYKNLKSCSGVMDDLAMDLYSSRMLTVVENSTVRDIAKHTKAPLALSHRDGRLIHALGRSIWAGETTGVLDGDDGLPEDISAIMKGRARCLHESRYTVDAASNIQMLLNESLNVVPGTADASRRDGLIQLWGWIAKVEMLCGYDSDDIPYAHWRAKGLLDAGVWQLLGFDDNDKNIDEIVVVSKSLHCNTYDSLERRSALISCGWSDSDSVIEVTNRCEMAGEYERAAALAVWHDDLGSAVAILQRGANQIREMHSAGGNHDERLQYSQTMQLVAMCIAGFPGAAEKSSDVWWSACQSLLERQDLSSENAPQFSYLQAACNFLLNIGSDRGVEGVLVDSNLRLNDRVAFACRFLERGELKSYLMKTIDESQSAGLLEGLVITGVEKKGLRILEAFVDQCSDVQTVALVTSRVILPPAWTTEKQLCSEWLDSYRSLLNTWQMWQSRAMFDVDRAELLRKIGRKTAEDSNSNTSRIVRRVQPLKKQIIPIAKATSSDSLIQPSIPAQLDARCNYCSMSLSGARRQENSGSQWLSKQKPVLSCCPSCRKPLPRCAICLLSLGCLNPYMELKKERSRSGRGVDSLDSLANLPFAEWFTWCMRCKHGGHAHHLVGWFANHESCPVSDCNCRCQFDGIKKLA